MECLPKKSMEKARTSMLKEGINQFMILSLCFCKAEREQISDFFFYKAGSQLDDMLIKMISRVPGNVQ